MDECSLLLCPVVGDLPGGERKINNLKNFIGIDIAKKTNVVCIMEKEGDVLEMSNYLNRRDTALSFFTRVKKTYPDCGAVFESTGNMWFKTMYALEECSIPFKMANPLRLKLSQSGLKTDKIDAQVLANRFRMGDIPESYVYPAETRRQADILTDRINQIKARTVIINRQHNILHKYDHNMSDSGSTDSASDTYQNYLDSLQLEPGDMRRMAMCVQDVRHINGQVAILESMISKEALENEDAMLIMSMKGFEAFGALTVATAINGIERFPSAWHLVSFMGLCPRVYQSGDTKRHGRMKKDANRVLTWVMIRAAMVAVRYDPRMKSRYEGYRKRHPPLVAYSHVANYMAKCIYYMLKNRELYRYYDEVAYEKKLKVVRGRAR